MINKRKTEVRKKYNAAKNQAKRKGLEFSLEISDVEFIARDRCPISRCILVYGYEPNQFRNEAKPRLMRIDPSGNFVLSNMICVAQGVTRSEIKAYCEEVNQKFLKMKARLNAERIMGEGI